MPRGMAMLLAASLLLAGCGAEERALLPPACGEGPEVVSRALERAPAPVTIDDTKLSECLTPDASGAELQSVGLAYVETAADLSAEARRRPEGKEALQLGYLVGAAHRGGDKAPGFHTELIRRLDGEAAALKSRSQAFRRGEAAGRKTG